MRAARPHLLTDRDVRGWTAAAAVLAVAFAVLAVAVSAGALTRVDQFGVDHLMPDLSVPNTTAVLSGLDTRQIDQKFFPRFHSSGHRNVGVAVATYVTGVPASLPVSVALVVLGLAVLAARGRRSTAVALGAAFVVANVAVVLTKASLVRPPLRRAGAGDPLAHLSSFDAAFPSGHTDRAVLVAVCLGAAWPRLRPLLAAWALAASLLLVPGAWHTPTDVAGGLLVAGACCAGAIAGERALAARRRRAARARPPLPAD